MDLHLFKCSVVIEDNNVCRLHVNAAIGMCEIMDCSRLLYPSIRFPLPVHELCILHKNTETLVLSFDYVRFHIFENLTP